MRPFARPVLDYGVGLVVDQAEFERTEVDGVVSLAFPSDAHQFSDKRFAQKKSLAALFDVTLRAHTPDMHVVGIAHLRDTPGIASLRGLVEARRRLLAEGFVRTLLVVLPAEDVEGPLLGSEGRFRRACSLLFERAVHAFVPAVLVGPSGRDALGPPEAD